MDAIRQTVRIDAKPGDVYDALSRPEAYRGWWAQNSAVADWEGGESLLHFKKDGQPVSMRFRVDELSPPERVHWTCVANDAPPWQGTTLTWQVSPADTGTELTLEHGGWAMEPPPPVAQGWSHFLSSLKSFVEEGKGQPW